MSSRKYISPKTTILSTKAMFMTDLHTITDSSVYADTKTILGRASVQTQAKNGDFGAISVTEQSYAYL